MRNAHTVVVYQTKSTCFHEGYDEDFGKTIVSKKVYETMKYTLKSGGEGSIYDLVAKEMCVVDFISYFKKNIFTSM